ncbi:MAG: M12 family metallopeptidase [Mangrovibacterium sp.]
MIDNTEASVISIESEEPLKSIALKSGVVVQYDGENYFYESDIVLTSVQLQLLDEAGTIFDEQFEEMQSPIVDVHPMTNMPVVMNEDSYETKALGIYPTSYNLWAMVRFVYNANLNDFQKQRIKSALLEIESNTNIRFYNATGQPTKDPTYGFQYPYIDFTSIGAKDVSSSYVGRIGGRQQVSLADFAFNSWNNSVIIHEILHACGMLHEQCRNDRDSYVTINWSNLKSAGSSNFSKRTTNYYMINSYDFNSIMGYSSYTSSSSAVYDTSKPMYTKKDGSAIYQGYCMSSTDRMWVNRLYLPYIARKDVYRELADVVYDSNNRQLSASERLQLQAQLNYGNPYPPANGRIKNEF